ncbi:ABC transporter ATP-binding protein [Paenibacillus sp. PL91]|uniref:ABC transporter ATP-binding protein n=1 Tax=Paenibacillus sp. PL91 TaxID=2729538 RepID=UPI00145CF7BC|nr:ABC transporter ATP-binding protein [Paenibacillus sp. PL91]MBC9198343.1 ABC transporter ATP-binding protein [Paenibacillus sp. PL91]
MRITALLSLRHLSYSYPSTSSKPIFSNLSLEAHAGEFVSIIGASGSGKSTLFKLMAGLLQPDEGEIRLRGELAANRLGKVAYMPQKDLLLPWRSVLDNCMLPLELARGDMPHGIAQIRELLQRFGLAGYEHAYPDELSGGMRQRVAFLRTLMTGQELLLLDEPFGALDAMTKRGMHKWLLELWGDLCKTVLFITHDLEEAILLSDRIYVMSESSSQGVQEIIVQLPRPRHYELNYEAEFVQLRQDLERRLHAQTSF